MIITFDVETGTKNKGNPFTASGKLISYSIKPDDKEVSFNYHLSIDFLTELKLLMQQAKLLVGFNIKFDLHWVSRYGVKPPDRCRVWDCQIAEFILSGQKGAYPSLDGSLAKYDLGAKDDKIAEYWKAGIDTEFIPQEELEFYNNRDVDLTYALYLKQQEVMTEKQKRLCLIMGLDLLVLQEMEENGVKFDINLCKEKAVDAEQQLRQITEELLKYSPSPRINLDSGQHLSCLLYGGKFDIDDITYETAYYKGDSKATGAKKGDPYQKTVHTITVFTCPQLFTPLAKTETKLKKKLTSPDGVVEEIVIYETNEDVLKQLKAKDKWKKRVIELLLQRAEVAKLLDTYYGKLPELLEKMEWGEYLHGQYNQCVAATGRLSSSAPNMQNFSGDVDRLLVSRYAN
jgi:DNA polymerase I-like protein with 3'-5' exonuclease and polymerase domains